MREREKEREKEREREREGEGGRDGERESTHIEIDHNDVFIVFFIRTLWLHQQPRIIHKACICCILLMFRIIFGANEHPSSSLLIPILSLLIETLRAFRINWFFTSFGCDSPVAWQFCSRGPPDPWGGQAWMKARRRRKIGGPGKTQGGRPPEPPARYGPGLWESSSPPPERANTCMTVWVPPCLVNIHVPYGDNNTQCRRADVWNDPFAGISLNCFIYNLSDRAWISRLHTHNYIFRNPWFVPRTTAETTVIWAPRTDV